MNKPKICSGYKVVESAKLHARQACVPACFVLERVHVLKVLTCFACLHVYLLEMPACLACLLILCPNVLTCLTCFLCSNILQAYVLVCLVSSFVLFTLHLKRLNFKNSYKEEFGFYSEAFLEPIWRSMMESFCQKKING